MEPRKTFTEVREEISDEELTSLMLAIKQRYGIDFTNYEKKSLKRGVARLISKNNMHSLLELWGRVIKERDFFMKCIDELLVNLTEMFRNPEIWFKIKDDLLPKLDHKYPLNIWHAGCSTGEEIYTMAIVLKELGIHNRARLTATDLSAQALANAMSGVYAKMLWRKYMGSYLKYFPGGKMENYFEILEDEIKVKDDLKRNIQFERHNLVQDAMEKKFSVIFCRNVMIYFDDALKMKVLKLFHSCLDEEGFFIIGYYDMLPDASKDYFTLYDATTRVYKKRLA